MSAVNLVIADTSKVFADNISKSLLLKSDFKIAAVCRSGAELISTVKRIRPDAVLMDTVLEDIDGITVLKRLGRDRGNTVFIICSEFTSEAVISRAARYGASAFIAKPADRAAIVETIEETVAYARENTASAPEIADRIDTLITESLLNAGISSGCAGFVLLRQAVRYMLSRRTLPVSMTKQLYPELARIFGSSPACVERNIRSAIIRAHSKGMLHSFPKRPTNRELILRVASAISENMPIL